MLNNSLSKKVVNSIKLIQLAALNTDVVEVAYSGGKDSDVILELVKMSGINYRAIYKNTTIDPPGTILHVKEAGAEILNPKNSFFDLIKMKGAPHRFARFCCQELKEYKVLDKVIIGVRRAESSKRAVRYSEPTMCRFYGSKNNHVEQFFPILEWSNQDLLDFILDCGLKLHPLYYRDDGSIDVSRRLGCMCCPLASHRNRLLEFKKYPNMVKSYIKCQQIFRDSHPLCKNVQYFETVFDWFLREVFFVDQKSYVDYCNSLFKVDSKTFIEDYFNIKL